MNSAPAKKPPIQAGRVLDDRFKILGHLGGGGFAEVYRANQLAFGHAMREVALKVFAAESVTPANVAQVFNDAIQLIRLQGAEPRPEVTEHLIKIYDVGTLNAPEPMAYMSMELIPEGRTLRSLVSRWKNAGGMPVSETLVFIRQILIPLTWMHTLEYPYEPIAHGDLKPENVLLDARQNVVLSDFGLTEYVSMGVSGGTLPYQSPELLEGLPGGLEADIYALGAMWYELLTGRRLFEDVGWEARAANDREAEIRAHLAARRQGMRPATGDRARDEGRIPPASEINAELRDHPRVEAHAEQVPVLQGIGSLSQRRAPSQGSRCLHAGQLDRLARGE